MFVRSRRVLQLAYLGLNMNIGGDRLGSYLAATSLM